MIAIDTNVVVRLLVADDPAQHAASARLLKEHDVFVPDTVVLETEWVLRFAYRFEPAQVVRGLRGLFGLPNMHLAQAAPVAQALRWHEEQQLDFADALHLAQSQHLSVLKTFDRKFIQRAAALGTCQVEAPR
ncbi:type II toxin-antitoxin system VapC family toxin [Sphaerotilus microaerophilus]|uniref:PIN domain-containing protein n=1 Tax=Sphaerotilus microaerophilus TaxID=2914710 RepID=A0ABM7YR44_9BURK|nr:type II toxin-antitoxin system VapC family toxin [Sphaerotilus sp. FB-5]BDI06987.1 hypothetical protein CATMQ487_39570 [Sphaerotilus sp. FB-5]